MELLLLLLVLIIVTVVGHGIWVAVAAFFRLLGGQPRHREGSPRQRRERCINCATWLTGWQHICPACGLDQQGKRAARLREAEAIQQLRGLLAQGDIDGKVTQQLVTLLDDRGRSLRGEPPPLPTAAPIADAAGSPTQGVDTPRSPAPPIETVRVPPFLSLPSRAAEEILDALPATPEPEPEPAAVQIVSEPEDSRSGEPSRTASAARLAAPTASAARLAAPTAAVPPRRLTSVLSAFMEERNILWGELVGGLLIVGCSIALVLTLWHSLQALPYFPFLLFTALTASLFAAGQYTLHHWKLQSTSRGLLLIAMLLAPLNLLVLADPTARGPTPTSPWIDLAVGVAAVGAFVFMVRASGRDLIGTDVLPGPIDRRWLLAFAVVGAAGSQLLTHHLLDLSSPDLPSRLLMLAGVPGAFHLLACGAVLGGLALYGKDRRLHAPQAHALFTFLGLATFALLASFTFLLSRLDRPVAGLHLLACPLILAGVPGLASGLVVFRRLQGEAIAGLHTAGTGVALAGVGMMLAGVALAWPDPVLLLAALLLAGAVLTVTAFTARAEWIHAGGLPCLTLAVLAAFYLATGALPASSDPTRALLTLFASADSGALLVGVAAVLVGLAAYLAAAGLAGQALALEWGAVSTAGTALLIATAHGFDRPLTAAAVHGAAALAGVLLCARWRSGGLAHVAVALVVPATLWALYGLYPHEFALWGVVLALESLALAATGSWRQVWNLPMKTASSKLAATEEGLLAPLARAAGQVALFTGALALLTALTSGSFPHAGLHTATTAVLSLALLLPALQRRSSGWFTAFQAGLIVTVLCAVTALAHPRGWLADARGPQAYGVGLALLSLAWVGARRAMVGRPMLESLLPRLWMGLDRLLLGGLVIGSMVPAVVVAGQGILAEWAPNSSTEVLPHLFGPGGWLVLGVLAMALLAQLIAPARRDPSPLPGAEKGEQRAGTVSDGLFPVAYTSGSLPLLGLVWLSLCAATWWAGMHVVDRAGASALRWSLAGCFLGGSILLWLRKEIARLAERVGLATAPATGEVRVLFEAAACVVVFLTVILTGLGFRGDRLPGPLASSVFAQMGTVLCSIGPMVLVIAGLVGTAFRERSAGYALAAGLLTTVTAMGGYALGVVQSGAAFDFSQALLTVLIGCTTAGAYSLAWLACAHLLRLLPGDGLLPAVQAWLGLTGVVALSVILLPGLLFAPGVPAEPQYLTLGGPVGWLALMVSAGAALWHTSISAPHRRVHVGGLVILSAGILGGSLARMLDTATWWMSYHVLTSFWSGGAVSISASISLLPPGSRRWQRLQALRVRPWLAGLAVLLTVLALRGMTADLARQMTPIGAALAASVLTGSVALWFRQGGFVYPSGLLFALATFLTWMAWGPSTFAAGGLAIVIGLALAAAFWQAIELPQLRIEVAKLRWRGVPFSPIATAVSLILLAAVVALAVAGDALVGNREILGAMGWCSAIAVGVALLAALGDANSRLAWPGLYVFGLVLAGMVLQALGLPPERLAWAGALALAIHAGIASMVASYWPQSMVETATDPANRLRLPALQREWPWLVPAQVTVAVAVILLGFGVAINLPALAERLTGPLAIMLLVPAALALARVAPGEWSSWLATASEACAAAALAALAWAVPDSTGVAPWLQRNAWLLAALTASCVLAMQVSGRIMAEQHGARLRQFGLVLGWMAVLLAPVLLGQMVPLFDKVTRRTPLAGPAIACVALALVALVAQALQLALRPERDPMKLPEHRRTAYVYLAEVLLVCLFLHARLNVPELFSGLLAKYWTLIVLLLAFLVIGLSELCERHDLRVLAVPLQRTGIFLPLVPLAAFWVRTPAGMGVFAGEDGLVPPTFDFYALLWFLSAAVYTAVAMARRSVGWAIAAALAVNFGLWSLLMHSGVGFLVHPQAWLIPLGVIVLASEYINHDRLPREASQGLRYLGISLIYVASTADLFLAGLGNSVWLPVILAVLCVAGVLTGILLRVRAFLFLGVGFLLVDVLAMIWHAAVDRAHTWLWWACGIVLGTAILALFAVFEKRRNDVLDLLERFRAWE
jgi:hypothetical protein